MSPRPTKSGGNTQRAAEHRRAARRHTSVSRCCRAARPLRARGQRARAARAQRRGAAARSGPPPASIGTRAKARRSRERDRGLRLDEPAVRGDHEHARAARRRRREALRIRELAAKVERRQEAEDLAERSAFAAHALRELEAGLPREQQLRAPSRAARRRQQEYAMRHGVESWHRRGRLATGLAHAVAR